MLLILLAILLIMLPFIEVLDSQLLETLFWTEISKILEEELGDGQLELFLIGSKQGIKLKQLLLVRFTILFGARKKFLNLDANHNWIVRQTITLTPGAYFLGFQRASRTNVVAASNRFSVYWNGKLVRIYAPTDYALHTERFFVTATASNVF